MPIKKILFSFTFVSLIFVSGIYAQQPTQNAADVEYQLAAILYTQRAAEYRALSYQAFNVAKMVLDQDLSKKHQKTLSKAERKIPRAIVVDIDETVLDNSPAQAYAYKNKTGFNLDDWYAWGKMEKAEATPGAVAFLNYAVSKKVKIFFISNRDEVQKPETIANLKKAGFADVSEDNVLLRTKESGKDARRAIAAAKYRIVLLMGDNLDDFTSSFEKKSIAERFAETDNAREQFGRKFIVLPNAMYGTWENAIYEYNRLTEEQKAEKRAAAIKMP